MIEIHELIIEARVTDDSPAGQVSLPHQGIRTSEDEKQLVERITQQVMRKIMTELREELWGMK